MKIIDKLIIIAYVKNINKLNSNSMHNYSHTTVNLFTSLHNGWQFCHSAPAEVVNFVVETDDSILFIV